MGATYTAPGRGEIIASRGRQAQARDHPGTYVRAALLVGLGVVLWVVNWLIVRRQGPREDDRAATAPPST